MKFQSKELVAGSFVVGGLVGLLAIIAVLGDFMQRTDAYYTKVDNVAGLKKGAAVIYEGYIIGSVSGITPKANDDGDGMHFKVDIEVEKDWQIPETSQAGIASLSLLSAMAVQIDAGEGPALAPGSEIQVSDQMNFVDEISKTADNFARIAEENLVPLLQTVDKLLTDHGATTLNNVNELTAGLAKEVPRIAVNLKFASRNLNKLIRSVDRDKVKAAMDDVDTILANTINATAQASTAMETVNTETLVALVKALDEAHAATIQLNQLMQTVNTSTEATSSQVNAILTEVNDFSRDGGDQLLTTLDRLDRAALNIEEMTNILRQNPGVLITGTE